MGEEHAHRENRFSLFLYCNRCDQVLPHTEALVYTNRHNLLKEVAVKMSNTDLYNLVDDVAFDAKDFNEKYADGLLDGAGTAEIPEAYGARGAEGGQVPSSNQSRRVDRIRISPLNLISTPVSVPDTL